jgi:hypothetical protein
MERYNYDLSSYSAVSGLLGRLQTIATIPVVANDTLELDITGALRLSPLRKQLTLDPQVDFYVFYDKLRYTYGEDWIDFIKDGKEGTNTLDTINIAHEQDYLTCGTGAVPKHYVEGYNRIWNHYARVPNQTDEIPEDSLEGSQDISSGHNAQIKKDRKYGKRIARLPAFWNTGVHASRLNAEDSSKVSVTSDNKIDLIDIAEVKSSFKNEIDRDWFSRRYRDLMTDGFGSTGVSVDVDQRPEMIFSSKNFLSGYDVDGTDQATLGDYKGKSSGMFQFSVPPKMFNEHGLVWIMMAVRLPAILQDESHYLSNVDLDYSTVAGDPFVILNKRPIEITKGDLHRDSTSTNSLGMHPYAQWYRTQPNRVSRDFTDEGNHGFPFMDFEEINNDFDNVIYDGHTYSSKGYHYGDDFFSSEKLGHWNFISRVGCSAKRIIPPASKSINAGA